MLSLMVERSLLRRASILREGNRLNDSVMLWGGLGWTLVFLLASIHGSFGQGSYAVVSGSEESTRIGMDVLAQGGTAADAAVAVSLALGVAEPYGSGLGGKIVALYFDSETGRVSVIDGLDESSHSLQVAAYRRLPGALRTRSFSSVCTPGLPAGLELLHQNFGRLPWSVLVEPAANLAREGFYVTKHHENIFRAAYESLRRDAEAQRLYLPGGDVPVAGQILANPDLAATLERLARGGAEEFYRGETAHRLATAVCEGGGNLTIEDLVRYRARLVEPLQLSWNGLEIVGAPSPTTGGAIVMLALKALEGLPLSCEGEADEHFHRLAIALQTVYAPIYQTFGDDESYENDRLGLFEQAYLQQLIQSAGERDANFGPLGFTMEAPLEGAGCTTHFVVLDSAGNLASITQSIGHRFGAAVIAPGTGFLLNNDMNNFAFNLTTSPNFIGPGKRPRSTITPLILLKEGQPVMALGAPGGQRIPTALLQTISSVEEYGSSLGEAIAQPRFHLRRPLQRSQSDRVIDLEDNISPEIIRSLRRRGWLVEPKSREEYYFGSINGVRIADDGRVLEAVADDRRSGVSAVHGD